jgi:acetylornithine deacetylase/succinyl-diaminopimelate desuccinylase-like protein
MPKYTPFQRAHRRVARWSLYSSMVVSGLLVLALTLLFDRRLLVLGDEESRTREYWESLEEVDLLQRYVRIDTSHREIEGARFLARELRKAGLEPVLEEIGDGRANLWAVLEGESRDAIVLHNHIDVFGVVEPERWEVPPFSGLIEPPFLYGRGVYDMKSLAIAQLMAIRDLAAQPGRPSRSVIFLATADEEAGSRLGSRWILREQPDLVARMKLVLTEGGVVEPVRVSDVKYWGIEAAQKRFAEGEACAADREALEWLYGHLRDRQREEGVPRVTPEVADFLVTYAPTRQDDWLPLTLDRLVNGEADPSHFRVFPAYLRSLFLDEIVPFPVEPAEDGGYRMRMVAHLLPGADLDTVVDRLLPPWMTHGIDYVFSPAIGAATGSPKTSPDYLILEDALRDSYPETTLGPYFLSWSATDARFFRQAGIPAYGYSPFLVFSIESYRADTINERINLPGFVAGIDLYIETVRRLVGAR